MDLDINALIGFIFRWIHFFAGVTWIGILYYFNFIQTEYFKETEASAKSAAISKLVPRALWWFRYGALFTFISGIILMGYIGGDMNFYILVGMAMGTIMFLNVWLIIWPKQQIVIANNDTVAGGGEANPAAAGALAAAGLASRTNTLFSLPMLFFMGASAHMTGTGGLPLSLAEGSALHGVSTIAMALTAIIILGLEFNGIKGKTGPMTTVKGVIHCGVGLTAVLLVVMQYL